MEYFKFARSAAVNAKAIPISGISWGAMKSGLREKQDLALMRWGAGSSVSVVATQNDFAAACVQVVRKHTQNGTKDYAKSEGMAFIQAGNANAATGQAGVTIAQQYCQQLANYAGLPAENILPFATGVIGEVPQPERVIKAFPTLITSCSETVNNWEMAGKAIHTTDTFLKCGSVQVTLPDAKRDIAICGIAKGAAMIHPNMATMLCYVATDAHISSQELHTYNQAATDESFNRIAIEGDESTNDSVLLVASGKSAPIHTEADKCIFSQALKDLYFHLAASIVEDAEGCNKVMRIHVTGGATDAQCAQVAKGVAASVLLKTVLSAGDPNWGRIFMAAGSQGSGLNPATASLWVGDVQVVSKGTILAEYTEQQGVQAFAQDCVMIRIDLGLGVAESFALGCDLTTDYVRMNSEYRT